MILLNSRSESCTEQELRRHLTVSLHVSQEMTAVPLTRRRRLVCERECMSCAATKGDKKSFWGMVAIMRMKEFSLTALQGHDSP